MAANRIARKGGTRNLNGWERGELARFECSSEDELASFSGQALALYRTLMLKFASLDSVTLSAPFAPRTSVLRGRAHG
ncbi:MAG: hypothetical protein FJ291_22135 [Planctomycetes bacterium]|nr:hypothetical protein [Planctomycetota bacterium]